MKKQIALLFLALAFISCQSGKLSKTETVSEAETVIVGKIKITNAGKDITKNSRIYFDENEKGILTYRLQGDGLIIMKLPKGNHYVKLIYTPYGSANLPDGYAQLAIPENNKVYYIGEIEIDGTGILQKKFSGIVRDVQAKDLKEKKIPIKVTDKRAAVLEAYEKEFGKEKAIVIALLEVQQ